MKSMYCKVCEEEVEVQDDQDETQIHKECGSNLSKIGYVNEIFLELDLEETLKLCGAKLDGHWIPRKAELRMGQEGMDMEGRKVIRLTLMGDMSHN